MRDAADNRVAQGVANSSPAAPQGGIIQCLNGERNLVRLEYSRHSSEAVSLDPIPHQYSGQAAPFSTHTLMSLANSGRLRGGAVRPSPGFHPQPTSLSAETCSIIC